MVVSVNLRSPFMSFHRSSWGVPICYSLLFLRCFIRGNVQGDDCRLLLITFFGPLLWRHLLSTGVCPDHSSARWAGSRSFQLTLIFTMNYACQAHTLWSIFYSPLTRIPDGTLALVSLISCRKPFSEYEKRNNSTTSAPFCRSKLWYLFRQQEQWILHIPCRLMSWYASEFVFLVLSYRSNCLSTRTFGNFGIVTHSHVSSAATLYLSVRSSERLGNFSLNDVSTRLFIVITPMY